MGSEQVARARKGSRPGDSLADIIFNMAILPVLTEVHSFLDQRQMSPKLPALNTQQLVFSNESDQCATFTSDVTYVDDAAFALSLPTALDMATSTRLAVTGIFLIAAKRGFELNFQRGKTEILFLIFGTCSRKVKIDLFLELGTSVMLPAIDRKLHITRDYKHLGGMSRPTPPWRGK